MPLLWAGNYAWPVAAVTKGTTLILASFLSAFQRGVHAQSVSQAHPGQQAAYGARPHSNLSDRQDETSI